MKIISIRTAGTQYVLRLCGKGYLQQSHMKLKGFFYQYYSMSDNTICSLWDILKNTSAPPSKLSELSSLFLGDYHLLERLSIEGQLVYFWDRGSYR